MSEVRPSGQRPRPAPPSLLNRPVVPTVHRASPWADIWTARGVAQRAQTLIVKDRTCVIALRRGSRKVRGGRGARAASPEPICGPLLSRYGDRNVFSASPPSLRATGSRKLTVVGFAGGLRGFPDFPDPDLFAAFIPVRHRLTTGGRLPGLPGPGVSTPRAVRRPHAPAIPQAAGMSRARVRATIPGRRFPLDRTPPHVIGPGARRPPPRRDEDIMRPAGRGVRNRVWEKRKALERREVFPPMRL